MTTHEVYIVTGATGFLGNTIVRKLLAKNHEVRALLLPDDQLGSLDGLDCEIYYGDITQPDTLNDIFQKGDNEQLIVIHAAAFVYIMDKPDSRVFSVNIEGTGNIISKCLETDARLLYINSVHAIPEPTDDREITEISTFDTDAVHGIYAQSKAAAAQIVLDTVKNHGLNATILQPSGIIGPGDFGMTHTTRMFLDMAKRKLPMIVKGGYDFVDVRDVADGVLAAVHKGRVGECYLLSNRFVSLKEIARIIYDRIGASHIPPEAPMPLVEFVAPLCEMYYQMRKQVPLFTRYSLYTIRSKSNFSHRKAAEELGYTTRPVRETINDTVDWFIQTGSMAEPKTATKKRRTELGHRRIPVLPMPSNG